jgi:hypothetical protein
LLVRDVFQLQARGVSDETRAAILAAAEGGGAEVLSAAHPATTLEDLFLRVIRADAEAANPSPGIDAAKGPPPDAAEGHG